MQPDIQLNYWAILAAVAASMVIGFLWYGPILGKAWMKEMGRPADHKPAPKVMQRGMILMVIGSFLTAVMLAYSVEVWRLSAWKVGATRLTAFLSRFSPGSASARPCSSEPWRGKTGPGSCSASTPPITSSACRPWG